MQQIRSKDGTQIAFARSGDGPALLLVHGTVADHNRWGPVLAPLERHFTVYAMDRRGRGSSGDTEPYAIEREFEDVAAVIDSLPPPVDVLAHSFGGACALEAARLTANIHKLILYEPAPVGVAGILPPATAARIETQMANGDHDGVISTFLLEVAKVPQHELDLLRAAPSWPGRVAAAHTILREAHSLETRPPLDAARFKMMTTPTLLLLGGASPTLYRDTIEQLDAMLPESHIVTLPGQQHVAMNTAPDLFVREVLAFLLDANATAAI